MAKKSIIFIYFVFNYLIYSTKCNFEESIEDLRQNNLLFTVDLKESQEFIHNSNDDYIKVSVAKDSTVLGRTIFPTCFAVGCTKTALICERKGGKMITTFRSVNDTRQAYFKSTLISDGMVLTVNCREAHIACCFGGLKKPKPVVIPPVTLPPPITTPKPVPIKAPPKPPLIPPLQSIYWLPLNLKPPPSPPLPPQAYAPPAYPPPAYPPQACPPPPPLKELPPPALPPLEPPPPALPALELGLPPPALPPLALQNLLLIPLNNLLSLPPNIAPNPPLSPYPPAVNPPLNPYPSPYPLPNPPKPIPEVKPTEPPPPEPLAVYY